MRERERERESVCVCSWPSRPRLHNTAAAAAGLCVVPGCGDQHAARCAQPRPAHITIALVAQCMMILCRCSWVFVECC